MKNKNLQEGFIPLIAIAVIAVLAIGGGVYAVKKNKEAKVDVDVNTQASSNADLNANENANLGINANVNAKAKGTFRSLLALGKNTMCTFTSTAGGVNSSGTVYIATTGNMRGDFTTQLSSGAKNSSMIIKDGYAYVWSGTQGAKMSVSSMNSADVKAKSGQSVDLDSQVDYDCQDWTVDSSKFTLPSTVTFVDIGAAIKNLPSGINLNGQLNIQGE